MKIMLVIIYDKTVYLQGHHYSLNIKHCIKRTTKNKIKSLKDSAEFLFISMPHNDTKFGLFFITFNNVPDYSSNLLGTSMNIIVYTQSSKSLHRVEKRFGEIFKVIQ